jgi:hypothetical protein
MVVPKSLGEKTTSTRRLSATLVQSMIAVCQEVRGGEGAHTGSESLGSQSPVEFWCWWLWWWWWWLRMQPRTQRRGAEAEPRLALVSAGAVVHVPAHPSGVEGRHHDARVGAGHATRREAWWVGHGPRRAGAAGRLTWLGR